jgi:hypothetical protein
VTISELLSLVELTKNHILEQLPPSKTPIKRVSPPEIITVRKITPTPLKPAPLELQKKAPAAKEPLALKKAPQQQERSVNDILDLLKTHCPLLKLSPPPQEKSLKRVALLYDLEPQEEKQVLINLANALKKEGYEVEMIARGAFDEKGNFCLLIAERSLLAKDPFFKEIAKRDQEGKLYFGQIPGLVIPSLNELIAKPLLRRELWNKILELIR